MADHMDNDPARSKGHRPETNRHRRSVSPDERRIDDRRSSRRYSEEDDFDSGRPKAHRKDRDDYSRRSSAKDKPYHDRSASPDRSRNDRRRRSRSPPSKRPRRSPSPPQSPPRAKERRAPLPSQNESFRGTNGGDIAPPGAPPIEKQKPNYKPTGLLAKEANTVAGTTTVLKYHEPPEARKPPSKEQWRMYVFKEKDLLDTIYLYSRSAWLVGRDEKVTDYFIEHPSVSKQHAVIQFRHRSSTNEFGDKISKVKPYLIDLDSANGTKLNGKKIGESRYVELQDGDVIAFGDSEREYVMMLPPANAK